MAGAVVRVPNKHAGHTSVHASGHHEGHTIFDLGMLHANVGDDGVTNNCRDESEEHENASNLKAIGE